MAGSAPNHTNSHVPQLDGLRGFAALTVVVSHISNQSDLWNDMLGAGGGVMGVKLFFVLSGYLMGRLYLDRSFTKSDLRGYLVRRAARVLPLFYVVALVALAFRNSGHPPYEIDDAFRLLFLIDGSDVFWTIPIELHFYLAFVGIWALHSIWPRAAMIAVAGLALDLLVFGPPAPIRLLYWMQFFLAGLLISRWHWSTRWVSISALGFPLFILLFPRIASTIIFGDPDALQKTDYEGWHNIVSLIATSACLIATLNVPMIASLFSLRPLRFLGRISYSLYLLHMPIVTVLWMIHPIRQPMVFLAVSVTTVVCVAAASYRFIEEPARRFLNRQFGRTSARASTAQNDMSTASFSSSA